MLLNTFTKYIFLFSLIGSVIKLILKSRNVYYSTLRILGANYRHIKRILDIELFVNSSLAYITCLVKFYLPFIRINYKTQKNMAMMLYIPNSGRRV